MHRIKHLDKLQLKQVLEWIDAQDSTPWLVAVSLLFRTGCRSHELMNFSMSNLDVVNKYICVIGAKGSNNRIIPLSEKSFVALYDAVLGRVNFLEYLGAKCKSTALRELRRQFKLVLFKALGAGFGHLGPHAARATFAVNIYLDAGRDVLLVRELLGHRDVRNTLIYVDMVRAIEMRGKILKAIG
jgi:site-specific recombinase XerD